MASILQDKIHPRDVRLFQETINAILSGVSRDKLAIALNLSPPALDAILNRDDFAQYFQQFNSEGFGKWHDARVVEDADTEATTFLRRNLLKNVKNLQALVDDPKLLDPDKRAATLEKLIKMGGIKGDEAPVQVLKLSEEHQKAFLAAFGLDAE